MRFLQMSRYASLSREQLIARLESKEGVRGIRQERPFNFASYPTRHIALLVAYHGWPYSGLAIQSTDEDVPTVEGELQHALERCRLIEQGRGWEGCEFSRCGRTDRGVSGVGQVVTIRARSNRDRGVGWRPSKEPAKASSNTEFPYPRLINGLLPPSIRILAWSPVEPGFDARFSCSSRHYKYAFHLHPTTSTRPLDLGLMQQAADLLIGEYDFRNFCKLDGSKQILNHSRRVIKAWFEHDAYPGMVVFNLLGSAFLWHQVRHIISILLLVGSGVEEPSVVTRLLDVESNPAKPAYQMGHPLPLTLYDCGYENRLDWRVGSYDGRVEDMTKEEREMENDQRIKVERFIEEQRQHAELRAWQVGNGLEKLRGIFTPVEDRRLGSLYPVGGGEVVITGKYRRVMERPRGETPDEVNRKWREKKGSRGDA